ncbi:muscle M-line assembly protein unc-89-like [Lingula anatina]|uniref:Muscle M-line assembly protein unc-89-like n=1 Tax=Lingula anatina TaxID=7574 RepID=A0A1S3JKM4_LINAN|nr:muscle M-line assembly protein unc-89-like [Lingula anatina]|eukprot:XP_013410970.1 muscle M-line assembly protein unc-89-like [Lingula anatina]
MQAKEPIQEIVMDDDIVAEKVKPRDFKIRWPEVDESDGEKQQVASSTIDMKEVLEKPVTGVKTNVNEIILQKPVEEEPVKAHAETSKPKRKLVSEGTSMTGGITSKEEISMTDPIPKEKPEEEQEVGAHIEDYEAEEETQEIVTNLENEFEEEEDQEATERFDDDFELESQRYTPIEKEPRSEVPTIVAGLTEEESDKSERDFPKMTFSMMSFDIKNSALTRSKDSTDPLRSSAGTPDTVRSATMDFRPESAASSTASSILSPGAESSRSFTFVIPPQDARNSPSGNGMTNVSLTIPNPQKDGPNNQYVAVKETTEEKIVQALDEHGNPLAPPQRSVETLRTLFQSPQEPNPNGATALNIDSTGSLTTVALPYLPVGNRNNQLEAPVKGDMQTHSMTFRPLSPNEQGVSGYTFEETVVREKQFSTKSIKDPSGPYPALPPASERPTSRGSTVPPKSPMSPLQKGSDSVDPVSPSSTMSSGPTQWRGRGEATSRSQTGSPRSVVQQESPEAFSPSSTMSSGTSLQKERGQPPVRRYQTGSPARGRDSPSRPYSPSENRLSQQQQSTKGRHMYQQSVSSRTISASSPSEYQVFVKGHGPGGRQSPPAKHSQSLNRFHKGPNQLRRQSNSASQSHSSNQTFSMQRHLRKGQVFHDQRGSMVAGATHEENVDRSSLGRHPVRSGKGKWTSTPMGNI